MDDEYHQEIHDTVMYNDVDKIHQILKRNPLCVNNRCGTYQMPLHIALELNDSEQIIQTILEYGADVNALQLDCSLTPLHIAVATNELERVKWLLERGADPNRGDSSNSTALHDATFYGDDKMIKLLLKYGADVNAISCYGETPLDAAIWHRKFDNARVLIKAGAKARRNLKQVSGEESKNFIEFLIHHGAEIDAAGQFSLTALYVAFKDQGHVESFNQAMLELGIDVGDVSSKEKVVELHVFAEKRNERRVRALLEAGADVNTKNDISQTALHVLLRRRRKGIDPTYKIAKLLIEAGADLEAQDYDDCTPLKYALEKHHWRVANLILAKIAGVKESTIVNEFYFESLVNVEEACCVLYPLVVAIVFDYEEAVDRLIEMGHHIEMASNVVFAPPLYYAVREDHYEIAKMLLEAGRRIDEPYLYNISKTITYDEFDHKTDIRMVCLLWEFNEDILVKNMLLKYFDGVFKDYKTKANIYMLFNFTIALQMDKSSGYGNLINLIKKSEFLDFFNDKLDELRTTKIGNGILFYDILVKPLVSLVRFIEDKGNFDACQELSSSLENKDHLESYEHIVKVRIELAIEKRNLLDNAKSRLNEAIASFLEPNYDSLPDEIVWMIFKNLNVRELSKIANGN